MTALIVYDPPMCSATGICGADVDQRLVDFAADLDWLKAQGVPVRRINLSQEPAEFVANGAINALMQASGGEDLPALMVEGGIVSKGRYPSRAELAAWAGLSSAETSGPVAASASAGCCGGQARASAMKEKSATYW